MSTTVRQVHNMNRRSFLVKSGTVGSLLLAGCSQRGPPSPQPSPERPRISAVTSALPEDVEVNVELIETNHTQEPLTIRVSLMNNSDTDYSYGEARTARFVGVSDGQFHLYPKTQYDSDDTYRFDESAGVWVATEEYLQTMEYLMSTLKSGDTQDSVLRLLHKKPTDTDTITEYPPELHFDVEFKIAESENDLMDEDAGQTARAAFKLIPPKPSSE